MITVDQALALVFDLVRPLPSEPIALRVAAGRVLAEPAIAARDQPPFAASAMDGYAVQNRDVTPGAAFQVIGESAAGHGSALTVGPKQAVRIFTGAPVPDGADRIVIQEDAIRQGDTITLSATLDQAAYIRPAGADFSKGDTWFPRRPLAASDLVLLAAMNCATPIVVRKPMVALIATGDELVMPGEAPRDDQIIASNTFGLAAMIEAIGATARILPIARDNRAALTTAFAMACDADLVVTIGGASVGDHDLVGQVAEDLGMKRAFYKIAMRPGKPLMAGKINDIPMLGLPGNPVSAMVCAHIFLLPALRAMMGLAPQPAPRSTAALASDLPANGAREHYMRATLKDGLLYPASRQDSALTGVLAQANVLILRPVNAAPCTAGDVVTYLPL
ncbi:gephyrin-like molybdotransferase Glp [Oceaniglobus ichthyenteri]|uniref:molybdopterin molybdotransferase MoeA n=1 Tax=Oceaniglobus ichthyenteri TaxID=2136177 RepID=UPI000D34A706|nr:gephyrin-like molybdotransferase Glp [Oceaniglobus ichthyenteri]